MRTRITIDAMPDGSTVLDVVYEDHGGQSGGLVIEFPPDQWATFVRQVMTARPFPEAAHRVGSWAPPGVEL